MPAYLNDARADAVLSRLYEMHESQTKAYGEQEWPPQEFLRASAAEKEVLMKQYMSDQLVALEADKAYFCYLQCLALKARRIVEIGTSYGVSTIFLAAALRDNADQPKGIVIGTEYEPEKSKAARANWDEAGLAEYIELREGDLRETIVDCGGPVDFVLMDIWTPMARPALDLLIPQLAKGAVIIADNIVAAKDGYADYLERINRPNSGFRTTTLPFEGGVEYSVWEG